MKPGNLRILRVGANLMQGNSLNDKSERYEREPFPQ